MQQLSGLDASFLYLETANSPMHIGGLAIYDPSTAPGGSVGFKQILSNSLARVSRVSSMTNVLVEVPFGLDHPYWKADGSFDNEFHIRHIALPKPGDWRQLCILVSRLHARPLDRARPLWEMYIIEGLDNIKGYPKGSFAMLSKVHHAAIDGASGVEITAAIHDLSPDQVLEADDRPTIVDRDPTNVELLLRAQINTVKQPFRLFDVARSSMPGLARFVSGVAKGDLQRVTNVPRTRFNTNISPHRVFDAVNFDFEDIRKIKNSQEGVTVNDVALSICGGALRLYLQAKDELPERSLAAMAPVNVRTKDKLGTAGNQVSQMTVRLCTDIEDAAARLAAVHEGTSKAKELTNAIGAKTMTDYTQFMPSTLTASAAKLASRIGLANRMAPVYNCVITNVPGVQVPLYYTGAKMLSSFGLGPPIDGTGLFLVIGSYCGQFNISICCCREMMPDPAFFAECLQQSFDELLVTAQASSKSTKKSAKKPAKKKPAKKKQAVKPAAKKAAAKKKAASKPVRKKVSAKKKVQVQ